MSPYPYRNAIGLAVSRDGGLTFERVRQGPVVDRSPDEPYFTASPYAMIDEGRWRLWYCSGTGWVEVEGHQEPRHQIKHAESTDGIHRRRDPRACIEYVVDGEANARPCVLREDGRYRMWYCFRGSHGYRNDPAQSYRLGYAESDDGLRWQRRDEEVGIERSASGWDSQMVAYPFVYTHRGKKYMLYNGNGFGESGFGYAVLDEPESH